MPAGENVFYRMFLTDMSKEAWGTILSSGKPLGICLFGPSRMILQTKRTVNFPVFNSAEEMVRVMAMQMNFYEHRSRPAFKTEMPTAVRLRKADSWIQDKSGDIGEETIELLETFGVSVAKSMVIQDADQAAKYAQKIGFPVVMKIVSPDALHKSEAGGVVLNVSDVGQVRQSYKGLRDNLYTYKRDARFKGVRIGPMAPMDAICSSVRNMMHRSGRLYSSEWVCVY